MEPDHLNTPMNKMLLRYYCEEFNATEYIAVRPTEMGFITPVIDKYLRRGYEVIRWYRTGKVITVLIRMI